MSGYQEKDGRFERLTLSSMWFGSDCSPLKVNDDYPSITCFCSDEALGDKVISFWEDHIKENGSLKTDTDKIELIQSIYQRIGRQ